MTQKRYTEIPRRFKSIASDDPYVAGAEDIDAGNGKNQKQLNEETDERITTEVDRAQQAESTLDGKIAAEKQRAEGVEGGLNTRLQTVEQLAEISVGGGDAQIATGSDFENPDVIKRAKIPTVGAICDVLGFYTKTPDYIFCVTDSEKKVIVGIKYDFSVEWFIGIPKPVKEYIDRLVADISGFVYCQSDEFITFITGNDKKWFWGINRFGDIILKNNLNLNKAIESLNKDVYNSYTTLQRPILIKKAFGVNAHLTSWDNYSVKGIVPLMKETGILSLRTNESFTSVVSPEQGTFDWTNWDDVHYDVYKYAGWNNNIDIVSMLAIGASPNISVDNKPIPVYNNWQYRDLWVQFIEQLVSRSDGRGISSTREESEFHATVPYKCSYFEIGNELNVNYSAGQITLQDWFTIQRLGYEAVKKANPNAKVLFGGTSGPIIVGSNLEELFTLTYNDDGIIKHIWDYFDIFNYHYYDIRIPINMYSSVFYVIDLLKKYKINKPVWVTETGYTTLEITETEQAKRTPILYLQSFSYGIERMFYYQCQEYDIHASDRESYFGIIHNSKKQSCVQFLKNDGSGLGINNLDALRVSLYSDDYVTLGLTNAIVNNLQTTGMRVSVNRGNIKSVYLDDVELYSTADEDVSEISLNAELFTSATTSNNIYVHLVNYSRSVEWNEADVKPVYYSIKHLTSLMPDGSSVPVVETINGIFVYTWTTPNNEVVKALYCQENADVNIEVNSDISISDYMGNNLTTLPDSLIANEVIYIKGVKHFKL